jgi:hypothetical protein
MILVAFFYLLRPGEYTWDSRRTRTIPLRCQDIRLWDANHQAIPHTSSLAALLQATSATIHVANQKNGIKGGTVHHTATHDAAYCPINALARRVHAVLQLNPDPSNPLSLVGPNSHLTSSQVTAGIRLAAASVGLLSAGYTLDRVSAHSLRASGATFLQYIHSQISTLTAGLSESMSTHHLFINVGS